MVRCFWVLQHHFDGRSHACIFLWVLLFGWFLRETTRKIPDFGGSDSYDTATPFLRSLLHSSYARRLQASAAARGEGSRLL